MLAEERLRHQGIAELSGGRAALFMSRCPRVTRIDDGSKHGDGDEKCPGDQPPYAERRAVITHRTGVQYE